MGTSSWNYKHFRPYTRRPMGYVRDQIGRNRIEESLKGDKVVVVEDLISTGGSSIEVASAS